MNFKYFNACALLIECRGKVWQTSKVIRVVCLQDFEEIELQCNPLRSKPPAISLSDSDSDVFESPPISVKRCKTLSLGRSSTESQKLIVPL